MEDEKPDVKWVQVADNRWRRVSRRDLLKIAAAGAAAASMGPFANVQFAFAQIPARAAAEVAARAGHDLYQHISPPPNYEPEVEDLTDINEPLVKKYGQIELARRSSYNPKTKKWYGLSNSWVPDPGHYRKDLWDEAGFVPDSWDNVLLAGRKLKARGVP